MRIVLGIVLFVATTALAQQSIKINEPVGRQLSSGSVQSYTIELKAGGLRRRLARSAREN